MHMTNRGRRWVDDSTLDKMRLSAAVVAVTTSIEVLSHTWLAETNTLHSMHIRRWRSMVYRCRHVITTAMVRALRRPSSLILIGFLMVFVAQPSDAGTLILDDYPALRNKLLEWERTAPISVKQRIEVLRNQDAIARGYAGWELRDMGPKAKGATLALIENLGDSTRLMKRFGDSGIGVTTPSEIASGVLARIGRSAVEPLIALLSTSSLDHAYRPYRSSVRQSAIRALGELKDPRAVKPLIAALKDYGFLTRLEAVHALAKIRDQKCVGALFSALKDYHSWVRKAAFEALEEIKGRRAVEPFVGVLKDNDLNQKPDIEQLVATFRDYDLHRLDRTGLWRHWES